MEETKNKINSKNSFQNKRKTSDCTNHLNKYNKAIYEQKISSFEVQDKKGNYIKLDSSPNNEGGTTVEEDYYEKYNYYSAERLVNQVDKLIIYKENNDDFLKTQRDNKNKLVKSASNVSCIFSSNSTEKRRIKSKIGNKHKTTSFK